MTDTQQFALIFLGIPALVPFVVLIVASVEWAVAKVETAAARYQDRLVGRRIQNTATSFRQRDQQDFRRWLSSRTHVDLSNSSVDEELVAAQQQSDTIRVLVEQEVPKTILRCNDTHRLMARTTGAFHLSEIAYEPECYESRTQTIWLLTHTVEFLQAYPLRYEDSRLLHNSILLRKQALATCRSCPYIQLPAHNLPPLCPTAELVKGRSITS